MTAFMPNLKLCKTVGFGKVSVGSVLGAPHATRRMN
jgi:hypothetical protein